MASPSWFPIGNDYSRFHLLSSSSSSSSCSRAPIRWRYLLRKLFRDSKAICRSKPLTFQYDVVSYSQNFDDGSCTNHDDFNRPPRVMEALTSWNASHHYRKKR
ncbi:hypothetical protein ACLOJK_003193 [Asimina triloba]